MDISRYRTFFKIIVWSLWLPISIALLAWLRFSVFSDNNPDAEAFSMPQLRSIIQLLLWTTPCAIPLTLAIFWLYRRARKTAIVLAMVLCPLTTVYATVAGLLGPIGIALYSIVLSSPAWVALGVFRFLQRRKSPAQ